MMLSQKLQIFADETSKPFNLILLAVLVATGIFTGFAFIIYAGLVLFTLMVLYGAIPRLRGLTQGLAWSLWKSQAQGFPQGIREQVGLILREGQGVEKLSKSLNTADEIVTMDLTHVMQDVMRLGVQSRILYDYLSEWDLGPLRSRMYSATEGSAEYEALEEQVKVIEELMGRKDQMREKLSTLHAQLGAIRARLLKTTLDSKELADVQSELTSLKDTAHTISESYEALTSNLSV